MFGKPLQNLLSVQSTGALNAGRKQKNTPSKKHEGIFKQGALVNHQQSREYDSKPDQGELMDNVRVFLPAPCTR